ncbi:DinB family protein [Alicyclobacillus curvatus]|nr:DinB family protein [Alicyclobacillus curvatus]
MMTLEQIEATRSRLLSLLTNLTDVQLNWKPDASSWSVSQVVQHVAAFERRVPAIIQLGFAEEANYVATEPNLEQRMPDRSTKFDAPPQFHPTDEPKTLEELKDILEQSHGKFLQALNSVQGDSRLDVTSPQVPHPVFGRMSTRQWIESAYYHEVRHIFQIEELIELQRGQ